MGIAAKKSPPQSGDNGNARGKSSPRASNRKRISRRVLVALDLKSSVVGVFKHPNRPHFGVAYTDEQGHRCSKAFPFRTAEQEVVAYAAAIKFRNKTMKASLNRRKAAYK